MSEYPATNGVKYQLEDLRRRVGRVEDKAEAVGVLRAEVDGLKGAMQDLGEEVSGLRRALYTAALSVAGGAMVFAFTVFQLINH